MHGLYASAMLLPPNFWTVFAVAAPLKIIAIAGALCTIIQIVKLKVPQLGGWWAVALNVILSTAGVLALTQPQNMLTVQTLGNVIAAALAAAGIHGSSKLLSNGNDPVQLPAVPGLAQKAPLLLVLAVMSLGVAGCNGFERTTYQILSASKADIDQAQADYESRKIAKTQAAYNTINQAKATQALAVQGMETYEEIKNAKNSSASALDAQQAVVAAILAKLPDLILAIKNLYTPPAAAAPPKNGAMLRWQLPAAA